MFGPFSCLSGFRDNIWFTIKINHFFLESNPKNDSSFFYFSFSTPIRKRKKKKASTTDPQIVILATHTQLHIKNNGLKIFLYKENQFKKKSLPIFSTLPLLYINTLYIDE